MRKPDKKLVFENGQVFYGHGFGASAQAVCEVVPNTTMVGYQELVSNPAYSGQMLCLTYPLVGITGMADDDYETRTPQTGGVIVRDYNDSLANFRAAKTLAEAMEEYGVPGIAGVDTRRIARMLRGQGALRAALVGAAVPDADAQRLLAETPEPAGQVQAVSSRKKWYVRTSGRLYTVAAVDLGIKNSTITGLTGRGCNVTVVPYNTPAADILNLAPDGLLLSGGPGNPQDVPEVVALVKALQSRLPIFGLGLGCQLIALAGGCKTYKLPLGHHGGNYPVLHLASGKIEVTNQSHSYAVDPAGMAGTGLAMTHQNLLDGTVEGIADASGMLVGIQYSPDSGPPAQGFDSVFNNFTDKMREFKAKGGLQNA